MLTARKFHYRVRDLVNRGYTMSEVAQQLGMTIGQYQYWKRKAEETYPRIQLRRKTRKDRKDLRLDAHDGTCVEFVTWA